ncbi:putative reverse transcriptase domain-containing protein [Tanacetum coccineum]
MKNDINKLNSGTINVSCNVLLHAKRRLREATAKRNERLKHSRPFSYLNDEEKRLMREDDVWEEVAHGCENEENEESKIFENQSKSQENDVINGFSNITDEEMSDEEQKKDNQAGFRREEWKVMQLSSTRYWKKSPHISFLDPLTQLTQKNKTYVWGNEQDDAFRILKEKLCNAPVLALPDGPDDFVVYCDASKQGFRSVLMQRGKVIAYASRQTKLPRISKLQLEKHFERRDDGGIYFFDRIWIPSVGSVRKLIMDEAHTSRYSIHPGADKMYYDLRDLYWWPGLLQTTKNPVSGNGVEITMDLVTKFPRSSSGYDAIWVIVDRLTKSSHFLPIREDYKTEKLERIYITEIVARHSVPVSIISDHDDEFYERTYLGLQVKQKKDGIFISQDIYVAKIFKKFGFTEVKTASTPMETQKPLLKDKDGEEVDVHMYRYLKGQPKLGLWYPKDSPFDLVANTDSDYAGASLDRKSTTGGCQILRCRLISWPCKKQTMVANSITKAEYVAASSCRGQVLWIQNQLLDYG